MRYLGMLNTPVSSPQTGDRVVIGNNPTGIWAPYNHHLAIYDGSEWAYFPEDPINGWVQLDVIEKELGEKSDVNHTHPGGGDPFPVGSVFLSVLPTNPATQVGYGTWVRIAEGKFLVGLDNGDGDFDVPEKTGGQKTHSLTVNELPTHTHIQNAHSHNLGEIRAAPTGIQTTNLAKSADTTSQRTTNIPTDNATAVNQNTGQNAPHNNLPPYFVVYAWKRTA